MPLPRAARHAAICHYAGAMLMRLMLFQPPPRLLPRDRCRRRVYARARFFRRRQRCCAIRPLRRQLMALARRCYDYTYIHTIDDEEILPLSMMIFVIVIRYYYVSYDILLILVTSRYMSLIAEYTFIAYAASQ